MEVGRTWRGGVESVRSVQVLDTGSSRTEQTMRVELETKRIEQHYTNSSMTASLSCLSCMTAKREVPRAGSGPQNEVLRQANLKYQVFYQQHQVLRQQKQRTSSFQATTNLKSIDLI